ncbi:MAG: AEC family transporter [Rhodocyclales bacterium GT-UBC]|nr:MAG: AEC family transporter [Rhodocyclales bacterium GT-UBC]
MNQFINNLALVAPMYVLIVLGYLLLRVVGWPASISEGLTRFVFSVALPATLFHMMTSLAHLPPVDARLLIAFFGGCLLVFVIGRLIACHLFRLNGEEQTVFALGGIFSNNLLLGVPFAKKLLGDASLPSVALVLTFNSLILWSLVTVSIEWARHGSLSVRGIGKTAKAVVTNPIVVAIFSGTLYGMTGWALPDFAEQSLDMMSSAAMPLALIALGMGLAEFRSGGGWGISWAICFIKLAVQPLVVWGLAVLLKLPLIETQVVVLLASIAVGANVFLMARQFKVIEGPAAGSLLLSTALSGISSPLLVSLISHFYSR